MSVRAIKGNKCASGSVRVVVDIDWLERSAGLRAALPGLQYLLLSVSRRSEARDPDPQTSPAALSPAPGSQLLLVTL